MKSKTPFLDELKKVQEEKDIDAIAEILWNIITMYGLTMAEVVALNYYTMERSLKAPANKRILEENLKVDITTPTYHADGIVTPQQKVLDVQRALLNNYVSKLKERKN